MSLAPESITAVVLAGGFGTRIKHLLGDLPKPMASVAGLPFVEWVVSYLAVQKIHNVILSTGYLAETIECHFHSQPVKNIYVQCVPETNPLGTAGGFLNASRHAAQRPDAWLVLNGDSLALAPLDELFESLAEPGLDGAILGLPMADAARYGTISQDNHQILTRFNEKKNGAGVINAGVYLFRASVVETFTNRVPLSFETDVFPELIACGNQIKVCVTSAPFLDIGTPESLSQAGTFIQQHKDFFKEN